MKLSTSKCLRLFLAYGYIALCGFLLWGILFSTGLSTTSMALIHGMALGVAVTLGVSCLYSTLLRWEKKLLFAAATKELRDRSAELDALIQEAVRKEKEDTTD